MSISISMSMSTSMSMVMASMPIFVSICAMVQIANCVGPTPEPIGRSINECYKFSCETASFFVKINRSFSAQDMFEGEAGSLQAMKYAGMAVPHPLKVGDLPHGGSYFIMTHVPFEQDLMLQPQCQARLGEALSKMHLHQPERHQFYGFGHPTRLGTTEMENKFRATWSEFFVESRLRPALELVQAKKIPARYLIEHADEICASAKKILQELDGNIRPSILHGDLWYAHASLYPPLKLPFSLFHPSRNRP